MNRPVTTPLLLLALFFTGVFSGIIIFDTIDNQSVIASKPIDNHQNLDSNPTTEDYRNYKNESITLHVPENVSTNENFTNILERIDSLEQQVQMLSLQLSKKLTTPPTSQRFPAAKRFQLYTTEKLIQGGIEENLALDIVRQQSEIELERLELQDTAQREGYYLSPQYHQELAVIESETLTLRERLGDNEYDQYLFSSRQNNRVKVVSVMLGSAAELVGIQKDDIILDYDGQRMFIWNELKQATTQGERGEYVSVSVVRENELYSFSIPRGPLGIRLGSARTEP